MTVRRFTSVLVAGIAAGALAVAGPALSASAGTHGPHGKPSASPTSPTPAPSTKHAKKRITLTGHVTKVGTDSFVMLVKGGNLSYHGKSATIMVNVKTVIKYHGKKIALSQVPVGAKVTTRVAVAGDGTLTAIVVLVNGHTVLVPGPSPSPSA